MAITGRAVLRTGDDLRARRQQLYHLAAPVFRQHGYRDVTLKQLASACRLSTPALYRYFPSKKAFALFPISAANRPDPECFWAVTADPVVHLRLWLDHAAWERADFLLAVRLASEMGDEGGLGEEHLETFAFHQSLVASILTRVAPRLADREAREMAESLLAVSFGGETIGSDWSATAARRRFARLLLPELIRGGGDVGRLREVISPRFPHPDHYPCVIRLSPDGSFFANPQIRLTEADLRR